MLTSKICVEIRVRMNYSSLSKETVALAPRLASLEAHADVGSSSQGDKSDTKVQAHAGAVKEEAATGTHNCTSSNYGKGAAFDRAVRALHGRVKIRNAK